MLTPALKLVYPLPGCKGQKLSPQLHILRYLPKYTQQQWTSIQVGSNEPTYRQKTAYKTILSSIAMNRTH